MNNNESQELNRPVQMQEEDSIDIKTLIIKFLSYWYLFIIFGLFALVGGYLYNRYTSDVYQVSSSIYIKEQKMGLDINT